MLPSQARASTKAGLGRQVATHLLVAKLETDALSSRVASKSVRDRPGQYSREGGRFALAGDLASLDQVDAAVAAEPSEPSR